MQILLVHKKFLRVGLLALIAAASYWICTSRAETADRALPPAERPPMFVLQVGIGKYIHATWAELRGAVTDVVEMRKVLEGERYGIPPENIITLTDAEGTKKLIFEKFQTHLIAKARAYFEQTKKRDAVVMFEFSGHGSQAPDMDGDEKDDGKDETLVTYDSEDKPGKNLDITDDEIYALTSELRQWTDNIVYIFDSCHSGSGTRNAEDVRRLPERKTVPVSVGGVGTGTRSGGTKPADVGSGILPAGDDYIVITAARANELASQKNCFEECGDARKPVVYGNLTFYLIDELKNARSDTSYRELMENVTRRVVSEKPTQTPQIEGDKSRFVFGSLGRTEDNFVRITAGETKARNGTRSVVIRAGAMQGITPGTIVSFYDKTVTRFDGAEKVASGTVTAVTPAESTVDLLAPKRQLTLEDKALIIAPDLGTLKLKADLNVDAGKLTTSEKKVVDKVRDLLTPARAQDKREVELVTTRSGEPARWDVALLRDKFVNFVAKIPGTSASSFACAMPTATDQEAVGPIGRPDRDVFYFAGRDFVPFRFCMETSFADEEAAAKRLQTRLVQLAGLKSIYAIANKRSALNGKIVVKPIRLIGDYKCVDSVLTFTTYQASIADVPNGTYVFAPGEPVWFEVVNNSTMPIYVALLNVDPTSAVSVFSPRGKRSEEADGVIIPAGGKRIIPGDDCRTVDDRLREAGALRASRTLGIDRFKFIFSTARMGYEDFAYLEQPPLAGTRRGGGSLASSGDWTTLETVFQINDTGN
ncbi:MAG: caspase family protein [Acidobacteriota bacterium]